MTHAERARANGVYAQTLMDRDALIRTMYDALQDCRGPLRQEHATQPGCLAEFRRGFDLGWDCAVQTQESGGDLKAKSSYRWSAIKQRAAELRREWLEMVTR